MVGKRTTPEEFQAGTAGNYGPLNWIDYFIPDRDPNLETMERESPEYTLQRYAHNRKKVYGWTQVAVFFGTVAALLAGMVLTAETSSVLINEISDLFDGTRAQNQAWIIGAASIGSLASSLVAGFAGYVAFRTDIKNDVDQEALLAKQIGRQLAKTLEKIKATDHTKEIMEAQSIDAERAMDPATELPERGREESAAAQQPPDRQSETPQPNRVVSHAEAIARMLEQTQQRGQF